MDKLDKTIEDLSGFISKKICEDNVEKHEIAEMTYALAQLINARATMPICVTYEKQEIKKVSTEIEKELGKLCRKTTSRK